MTYIVIDAKVEGGVSVVTVAVGLRHDCLPGVSVSVRGELVPETEGMQNMVIRFGMRRDIRMEMGGYGHGKTGRGAGEGMSPGLPGVELQP